MSPNLKPMSKMKQEVPVQVPQPVPVSIESIMISKRHRLCDQRQIGAIAESISRLGLQHPITASRRDDGELVLSSGRHRLEACKLLGMSQIFVRILDQDIARAWTASENIHRVDLTRLERDEQILLYHAACTRLPTPGRGGLQPHDLGHSRTARELGILPKEVREARRRARICDEAKADLKANGLDNNSFALNKVAERKSMMAQRLVVQELVEAQLEKKAIRDVLRDTTKKRPSLSELKKRWEHSRFRAEVNRAKSSVRRRFLEEILAEGRSGSP